MSQITVIILALILVSGVVAWVGWFYIHRNIVVVDSPTPEILGELDGRAGIPNDVTAVPFPTPAMDGLYESGEQQRAALESHHVQQIKILQIRKRVLEQRAEELRGRSTEQNSSPEIAKLNRQLGLVEENLAARDAAVKASSEDHAARLDSLDAATKSQADRYWSANLRIRNRSTSDDLPHLDLDTLIVPEPSEWRAARDWRGTGLPVGTAGRDGGPPVTPPTGGPDPQTEPGPDSLPVGGGPSPHGRTLRRAR
jgi:hypothetical protein